MHKSKQNLSNFFPKLLKYSKDKLTFLELNYRNALLTILYLDVIEIITNVKIQHVLNGRTNILVKIIEILRLPSRTLLL